MDRVVARAAGALVFEAVAVFDSPEQNLVPQRFADFVFADVDAAHENGVDGLLGVAVDGGVVAHQKAAGGDEEHVFGDVQAGWLGSRGLFAGLRFRAEEIFPAFGKPGFFIAALLTRRRGAGSGWPPGLGGLGKRVFGPGRGRAFGGRLRAVHLPGGEHDRYAFHFASEIGDGHGDCYFLTRFLFLQHKGNVRNVGFLSLGDCYFGDFRRGL